MIGSYSVGGRCKARLAGDWDSLVSMGNVAGNQRLPFFSTTRMVKTVLHIPCAVPAEGAQSTFRAITRWIDSHGAIEQWVPPSEKPRLGARIRSLDPAIVHLHAPARAENIYVAATLTPRIKLIVHWHRDRERTKSVVAGPLEKALLRRADVIVATSRRYIEGSGALAPWRDKCTVIPPVVETERLIPDEGRVEQIRRRYGDKPLLLFDGSHLPGGGLEQLLEAIVLVRHDCRVVVGGQGPITSSLKEKYNHPRVMFTGSVEGEPGAWYSAADVFLFPSLTRSEAFGMALAEAMWCGTPAVTFTVPGSGINWVNRNGVTGIEVDNGNVSQLAAAIDHLLTHDEMRHEYGRAARRHVEQNMTARSLAPALEALYA